jgi:hypothetical protein
MSDFKIYEADPDSYPDAAHVDIGKEPISDQIAYGQLGKKNLWRQCIIYLSYLLTVIILSSLFELNTGKYISSTLAGFNMNCPL